jgi:hypothetical protein
MADSKISALPASTTPLAGTEVLPIIQSSDTKQVSVANLTAGRAISATELTLTTGNLIVASGQGIDFSATPGTGTSELLADYEEGTFTPSLGGSTTYATQLGYYTKIGKVCYFSVNINVTSIGTGSTTAITGLPFTALYGSNNGVHAVYYDAIASSVSSLIGYVQGTTLNLVSNLIPASSVGANAIFKNSADVRVQGFYFV